MSFAPVPGLDLTEREREVLALMIEGLNNTQLGVASRTEAIALALRNGIAS